MVGRGVARHGFLQFDADDQSDVVVARPQVGHRRQRRHTPGRAGGFVPRRRGVPQVVAHGGRHGPEVALFGEHLAKCVRDVNDACGGDVGDVHFGRGERGVNDLAGQIREVAAFFGEVARKVTLAAAQNPDIGVHGRPRYYN